MAWTTLIGPRGLPPLAAYAYTILDSIDEMQGTEQYIQGHYLVSFDRICHA